MAIYDIIQYDTEYDLYCRHLHIDPYVLKKCRSILCWHGISLNPRLTLNFVLNNKLPWEWNELSANPAFSLDEILRTRHLPWNSFIISESRDIKELEKSGIKHWDIGQIFAANKSITKQFMLRHYMTLQFKLIKKCICDRVYSEKEMNYSFIRPIVKNKYLLCDETCYNKFIIGIKSRRKITFNAFLIKDIHNHIKRNYIGYL